MNEKEQLAMLKNILSELKKGNEFNTQNDKILKISRSRKGSMITTNDIVGDYKKLKREIESNITVMKDNTGFLRQFNKGIRDIFTPAASLNRTLKETSKQLRENIKHESDQFKKVSMSTFDVLKEMTLGGKQFTDELDKIVKTQDSFNQIMKEAEKAQKLTNRSQVIKKNLAELYAQRKELHDEALKNGKNNSSELFELSKVIKKLNNESSTISKYMSDYKQKYSSFLNNIDDLQKSNINILTNSNRADLEFNEMFKKGNKKQKVIIEELANNMRAVNRALLGFESATFSYSKEHENAAKRFKDSSKAFIAAVAIGAVTRTLTDYQATTKYNVSSISPLQSGNMGMSQAELSTLIGENKEVLRLLGKGDQNAFIDSEQFKQLQNGAKMFGVAGKDAAELVGKISRLQLEMGQLISKESIRSQMDVFKKLSDTTNMTVDELIDFQSELNKSGFISTMTAQLANKSEKQRQELIADEIDKRYKLNKSLGMSNEQLKQRIQMETNSKYKDLASFIKQQIGGEIASDRYEQMTGKKLSDEQRRLFALEASNNLTLPASDPRKKEAMMQVQEFQTAVQKALTQGSLEAAKSGDFNNLYSDMIERQILGTFGVVANEQDNIESAANSNRVAKQINDNIFGKNAKKDLKQIDVNTVGASSDKLTTVFNGVGIAAQEVKEKFEGLSKSIFGGGIAAGVNLGASVINLLAASKGLSHLLGKGNMFQNAMQTLTSSSSNAAKSIGGMASNTSNFSRMFARIAPKLMKAGMVTGLVGEATSAFVDASEESKTNKGIMLNTGNNIVKSLTSLTGVGQILKTFGVDPTDYMKKNIENIDNTNFIYQQYDDLLKERINYFKQDPEKYAFGKFSSTDEKIAGILNSGTYSDSKLKELGANDSVLQKLKDSKSGYLDQYINPDMVMDGTNNDQILEILTEINKNTKVTSTTLVEESQKNDRRFDERSALDKYIDDKTKNLTAHFSQLSTNTP